MKVLVLGASGMLGHKACEILSADERIEVHGTARSRVAADAPWFARTKLHAGVDAMRYDTIDAAIQAERPDAIVNCIGVIKQSSKLDDSAATIEINALLPHRVVDSARAVGARVVQVSTDCVFSGSRGLYTEADLEDARDLYGRSKLLGEVAGPRAITLRTSIIGRALVGASGLIEWFLSQRGTTVRGYRRAVFSGLTTAALSRVIHDVLTRHPALDGLHHVSAAPIDKEDLLRRFAAAAQLPIEIVPDTQLVIDRSLDSSRFQAATGWAPPSWDDMLGEMAREVELYDRFRSAIISR